MDRPVLRLATIILLALALPGCDHDQPADYDGPMCQDAWVAVQDDCEQHNLGGADKMAACIYGSVAATFGAECEGECAEQRDLARRHVTVCVFDATGSDQCLDQRQACWVE